MNRSSRKKSHLAAVLSLAVTMLLLAVFLAPVAATAAAKTEADIRATLDAMGKAYRNKDIQGVMALYVKSPSTIALGAGKEVRGVGYEAIRQLYELKDFPLWKENTRLEYNILAWSSAGKVAWFAAELSATYITRDGVMDTAGRFTAVLKKTGKKWQFAQTHYSFPADAAKVVLLDFKQVDTNQDGKLEYKEVSVVIKGLTAEQFRKYDTNKDGYLSDEEFRAIWGR